MQAFSFIISVCKNKKNHPETNGCNSDDKRCCCALCGVINCWLSACCVDCSRLCRTVLQRVPVAPNEEQKVPCRVGAQTQARRDPQLMKEKSQSRGIKRHADDKANEITRTEIHAGSQHQRQTTHTYSFQSVGLGV